MSATLSKRAITFHDVVYNWDDQVAVRELVMKYTPPDVQERIIREYNARVDYRNAIIATEDAVKHRA